MVDLDTDSRVSYSIGDVVLARYNGARYYWARVTKVYMRDLEQLCDVDWLRPAAGNPGGPAYVLHDGFDETIFRRGLSVLTEARRPFPEDLLELSPPAGVRAISREDHIGECGTGEVRQSGTSMTAAQLQCEPRTCVNIDDSIRPVAFNAPALAMPVFFEAPVNAEVTIHSETPVPEKLSAIESDELFLDQGSRLESSDSPLPELSEQFSVVKSEWHEGRRTTLSPVVVDVPIECTASLCPSSPTSEQYETASLIDTSDLGGNHAPVSEHSELSQVAESVENDWRRVGSEIERLRAELDAAIAAECASHRKCEDILQSEHPLLEPAEAFVLSSAIERIEDGRTMKCAQRRSLSADSTMSREISFPESISVGSRGISRFDSEWSVAESCRTRRFDSEWASVAGSCRIGRFDSNEPCDGSKNRSLSADSMFSREMTFPESVSVAGFRGIGRFDSDWSRAESHRTDGLDDSISIAGSCKIGGLDNDDAWDDYVGTPCQSTSLSRLSLASQRRTACGQVVDLPNGATTRNGLAMQQNEDNVYDTLHSLRANMLNRLPPVGAEQPQQQTPHDSTGSHRSLVADSKTDEELTYNIPVETIALDCKKSNPDHSQRIHVPDTRLPGAVESEKPSTARTSPRSEITTVADVQSTSMRTEGNATTKPHHPLAARGKKLARKKREKNMAEQAYSWWQNTIASPFQKFSEDIENGFNRMINSIQEGDNEDEDEDDEDEQEEEEKEEDEEKITIQNEHQQSNDNGESATKPPMLPQFDIDFNLLGSSVSSTSPPHNLTQENYTWLLNTVAFPAMRLSKDFATAYKAFKDANDVHALIHKRQSPDALFYMACCLSLGAARIAESNGSDLVASLPPIGVFQANLLIEARLDLAVATLTQALDAGYRNASALLMDQDVKILRDRRQTQMTGLVQRAQANAAMKLGLPTCGSVPVTAPSLQAPPVAQQRMLKPDSWPQVAVATNPLKLPNPGNQNHLQTMAANGTLAMRQPPLSHGSPPCTQSNFLVTRGLSNQSSTSSDSLENVSRAFAPHARIAITRSSR